MLGAALLTFAMSIFYTVIFFIRKVLDGKVVHREEIRQIFKPGLLSSFLNILIIT